MKCRRVTRLLPLHAGGDLSPRLAESVAEHVESCAGCRAELRAFEESRQTLFCLKGPAGGPAPDLWPDLRERLSEERSRSRRRLPLKIAAAAVILLMAAGATLLLIPDPPEPATPVTLAPVPALPEAEVSLEFPLAQVRLTDRKEGPIPVVRPAAPERAAWDEF